MKKMLNKFMSNKFLVSFSMLASGSIIAQIISMLTSPISTRLFTPEQFGYYTIIMTAVSLFGPIICLKYDMAIVVSKNEVETYSIIKLCFLICLPLSLILAMIYTIIFIRDEKTFTQLIGYTCAITILLISYGTNNILIAHNNKNALYKLISSVTVVKSVVNNLLLIISGILNLGVFGIVGSQILGYIAGISRQSQDLRKNTIKIKSIRLSQIKKTLIEYKKQPIFNTTSALVTTSSYSFINIFIRTLYSVEQLGLYSLSYRILGIPFSVISANISRIFFDNASKESLQTGKYFNTYKKTTRILLITIIPMIIFIAILAPRAFSFVFGEEWKNAGVYVRLLAPMFAIRLIAESLTTSFIISGKQYVELFFQSLLFIGELVIYIFSSIMFISIEKFLLLISLLYILIHGSMILVMYKLSKERLNDD